MYHGLLAEVCWTMIGSVVLDGGVLYHCDNHDVGGFTNGGGAGVSWFIG